MPIQIYKLNYDFYFELDEGYHEEGGSPQLNEDGEQFVLVWNDEAFSSRSDPTFGGLTLKEAMATAENIVKQSIQWD